ncbi:hypothetical protein Leryth_015101 [Lithospermum erythrorhizon]|uniref:Reticulon-like protein n=1 Tax=Lithospermum erythrorhizon TaxID=34254 RepID=A0AAV3PBZ3_LITER|nr:hypothetical protein Leryth_015101 [Lithospermum erythrorhizon]
MSELSEDTNHTRDQNPHISSVIQDSTPPPLQEPTDGLPEKHKQPQSIPTAAPVDPEFLRDIFLWRRKNMSFTVLLVVTVIWVLLEIYKYNFVTLVCYIGMFFFTSMFFWGNMHRLIKKEAPNMSRIEMSEQTAMKIANTIRQLIETPGKWMFRVAAEGEWFEFVGVVAALYIISLVAKYFDFLTFLYIGVVTGLSLPIIYKKYENKIKQSGQRLRSQCGRYYEMIDDKLRKIKHKLVARQDDKTKKTE